VYRNVCVVVNEGCRKPSDTQCIELFVLLLMKVAESHQARSV